MRKLITIIFLLGCEVTFAQLYAPNGTIAGSTANGRVGIGIASPLSIFHVHNATSQSTTHFTSGVGYGALMKFERFGSIGNYYAFETGAGSNDDLRLHVSNNWSTPIIVFKTSGNIGMGTAIPMAKLDINGKGDNIINSTNKIIDTDLQDMISVHSLTKTATLNLVSSRTDAGLLGGLLFTTTIGASDSHRNIAGIVGGKVSTDMYAGGYLGFWTKNGSGDIPRENMRINQDGNVGIGTSNPAAKLYIVGSGSNINGGNDKVVSGDLVIQSNTGVRSVSTGAQLEFVIPANTDGTNSWGQGRIITVAGNSNNFSATGKMILGTRRMFDKLGTGAQWYYGDDLTIDAVGNIGIGTTVPDAKLAVKGDIHTKEVRVDVTGSMVGDYVFEKDYNLISLPELEIYLKQNKHLPEVPSAKEFETDGMKLKEMNLMLLKKVEELTLYMIEQQKEIKELKTEVTILKSTHK